MLDRPFPSLADILVRPVEGRDGVVRGVVTHDSVVSVEGGHLYAATETFTTPPASVAPLTRSLQLASTLTEGMRAARTAP